jgi:hypothetical protein
MGAKKKGKGKKKKSKDKKEGEEDEPKEENPDLIVNLVHYGWIRVEFRLCNAILPDYNKFIAVMRSDERVLELKKRIIDFHGRVEDIALYDLDPVEIDKKTGFPKDTKKPRIPPFRRITQLEELLDEREELRKKEELKAKREGRENMADETTATQHNDTEESKNNVKELLSTDDKFAVLETFDFKLIPGKIVPGQRRHMVEYDEKDIPLWEIFGTVGTKTRPKDDPRHDPEPPEKKVVETPPVQ